MIEQKIEQNFITKVLMKNSMYFILTYIDINIVYTDDILKDHLMKMCEEYPILKQGSNFKIENHYKIIEDSYENFDKYIDILLNTEFPDPKWIMNYIIDKENKRYRVYFKIDHSYTDGYKLIELLVFTLKQCKNNKKIEFKHTTNLFNKIYYIIFGTIMLIIYNIKIYIDILLSNVEKNTNKIDYIKCKSIKLSTIKKNKKITVNDFLYSLMIKTDFLYTNKERNIITTSPINISGNKYNNNMVNIMINISNNEKIIYVHELFNKYKYSLYIPIYSFILNTIVCKLSDNILKKIYNAILNKVDYVYSNIIGPQDESIKNIHFLTEPFNSEIVFNIISSNDDINIICSFKEGAIKDKQRFEECIYKAYESLI